MTSDGSLALDYRLERLLGVGPDADQLDRWIVTLSVLRADEQEEFDLPVRDPIGHAELYALDPDRHRLLGWDPFEVADAYSADAATYFEELFGPDGLTRDDVREAFELSVDRALIVHDVQVLPAERRRGYGALLAADALLTLAGPGTAVLAHPGPTDPAVVDADDTVRLRHETHNTRFLGALGFTPFRHRRWMLDLALQPNLDVLAERRRRRGSA